MDNNEKLDRPARVNTTVFGIGVPKRLVIDAAQRYYDFRVNNPPEGDEALKKKFFDFIDHGKVTDEQVEIVCRELFGDHASEALHLHVKQALKKAFENESLQNNN